LISSVDTGHWPIFGAEHVLSPPAMHILLATICGLVNQGQQQIIDFQNAQIEALLKKLGNRRRETPSAGIRTIELALGEWRADARISPTL